MAFASIHVPDFSIQAVVRCEPMLRNRAIALVDGIPPLVKVTAANEAALRAGIQLGMTKTQAEQFCEVGIRHRSQQQENAAHAALRDLGWSMSPRIEDASPDTILLDIAGLDSLFGSAENIANELFQRASILGLIANVAIASHIDTALLASRGFPGITLIPAGEEAQRLGQLPVNVLPASLETLEILERWGVRNCAALVALPLLDLSERLGQEGVRLHELISGTSVRSLALAQPSLSFEETMELEDSVGELEPLSFILGRLLDQLCVRLISRSLAAQTIHVRFELEPVFENGIQRLGKDVLPLHKKPTAKIYEKSMNLPVPMRDSKMLLKLLRLHLQSAPPAAPILKVSLVAEPGRPRPAQGGLFFPSSPDPEKLELTLARLANLVGNTNIGSPELVDTHRPDEFRLSCFRPAIADSEINQKKIHAKKQFHNNDTDAFKKLCCLTAFRAYRPALSAQIDLYDNQPVRVFFNGLRADVIAASGPWRTSGNWYCEGAWQQDEWDLELRFETAPNPRHPEQIVNPERRIIPQKGVYCIYFDSLRQAWFVRGVYD